MTATAEPGTRARTEPTAGEGPSRVQTDAAEVGQAASEGSPLDVMLTDAALGPVRRLFPALSATRMAARLATRPGALARVALETAGEAGRIAVGTSRLAPPKKDARFVDPAWLGNPVLARVCRSYLLASDTSSKLLKAAELGYRDEQRLRFALQLVTDALAPSNSPALNPAALKAAIDTGGRNYTRGLRHFLEDMSTAPRIPAMVDKEPFKVGGNVAVTPGQVVMRTSMFELIQYAPRADKVRDTPLLFVPPMINKYYVADLAPGRSMVEHLLDSGQQVFMISWRNPRPRHRDWGLDDYVRSVTEALDATLEICRTDSGAVFGLCAGGQLSSLAVAHLTATGQASKVAALVLAVTMLDLQRSQVTAIVDENAARLAASRSSRKGYLDGRSLASVFAWLRPNDLVWNYWVNNYLLGKKPPAFDVLFWNSDTTRMPAGLHRDFLAMAQANALVHPGDLTVLGTPIDLASVKVDSYAVAGVTDHLCPWETCFRSVKLLGGQTRFVLSYGGHIAALVNPPDNPKARFESNETCPDDPYDWRSGATAQQGSWWTDVAEWLSERTGELKDAPSGLGSSAHPPIGAAPGTYVLAS